MAADYLVKADISAAGNTDVVVPTNSMVVGIFASNPIKISWKYNDEIGPLVNTATDSWMPPTGFIPAPFSKLIITTTAATSVSIVIRK